MRITDFLINLFTKYAPVDSTTISELKVKLNNEYMEKVSKAQSKAKDNEQLENELLELSKQLESLKPDDPNRVKIEFEIDKIEEQIQEPTLIEKTLSFFEKPIVRAALIILFAIISRWIAKKLTQKTEEKPEEEEYPQPEQPSFYPYGQYYPPYPPQQGFQQPSQRYR
jgi:hypothetical protein